MYYIIANESHLNKKTQKELDAVKSVFDRAGKKYEFLFTKKAGDATEYTRKITSTGEAHTVIAMGGDGTLHEILNGFADFDKCNLGLIPWGTGNDFAAAAKIPNDAKKAAEIIAFRAARPIDFIQLSSGIRSINAVGMGIDVDVLKRTYASKSKRHAYFRSLISSLLHFKCCHFTVRYDGKESRHYGLIAALGNGRQIGGGIPLFPDASIDDGYMEMFIVDYISRFKMVLALIKLMRGKINKLKGAIVVKTKEATFLHEDDNYTIQAEGELYDNMPIEAKIVEGKLKFYLPA